MLLQRHTERAPIKDMAYPHLQCAKYSLPPCLLSVFENLLKGYLGRVKHSPCLVHGRLSIRGCVSGEEEHFAQCLGVLRSHHKQSAQVFSTCVSLEKSKYIARELGRDFESQAYRPGDFQLVPAG